MRLNPFEGIPVDHELAHCVIKVVEFRCADEALDLDRDFPRSFFRAQQSFRAQVNLQFLILAPFDAQRIVRDLPAVFFQSGFDVVVIDVSR